MNLPETIEVLNRLLQILCRSLPMYLSEVRPGQCDENCPLEGVLGGLVHDQRALADCVAKAILALGGTPDDGTYPMRFMTTNDLALEHLLSRVIDYQRQDAELLQQCADDLADAPQLKPLAEEALGNVQGHLDILQKTLAAD